MVLRRLDTATALAALLLALCVGVVISAEAVSLRTVQIALGVVLVAVVFLIDDDAAAIPRVLRPAPLIFLSALVGSLSVGLLSDDQYESAYVGMWLCQITGFLLAIVWRPKLSRPLKSASRESYPSLVDRYAVWMFWIGVASGSAFFAVKGIPLFSGAVEQGRVDVATSGTGYFRLLAFMAGPAAVLLAAVRGRRSWPYVLAAAALIALFGNRIPLVYLGLPIVAMVAIVGHRLTSRHLIATAAIALAAVAAVGTYRVFSQPDFRSYEEYRVDLAQDDKLGVALTSVTHYAEVVPANAVLVKQLVDNDKIPYKYGTTYGTLFLSALPGEQLSPDLLIKQVSGREFVGGGTPPTLMGEGYMNFGYPGIIFGAFLVMWLARYWASVAIQSVGRGQGKVNAAIYGYVITWCTVAQVGGLAGAATIPLAGFLLLIGIRWMARKDEARS